MIYSCIYSPAQDNQARKSPYPVSFSVSLQTFSLAPWHPSGFLNMRRLVTFLSFFFNIAVQISTPVENSPLPTKYQYNITALLEPQVQVWVEFEKYEFTKKALRSCGIPTWRCDIDLSIGVDRVCVQMVLLFFLCFIIFRLKVTGVHFRKLRDFRMP